MDQAPGFQSPPDNRLPPPPPSPAGHKKIFVLVILVSLLALASLGFNFYQYQKTNELWGQKNSLSDQIGSLNDQITSSSNQVTLLNNKIGGLEAKTKNYLSSQNETCSGDAETCLDAISARTASFNQSFSLVSFASTTAAKLGASDSQFKINYVAVANVNPETDIGCHGKIDPLFIKYFYTELFGASGFCSSVKPAAGRGLSIIGFELELYGSFPQLTFSYVVTDPDTGKKQFIPAQRFLPFAGGHFEYTPVGNLRPLSRIVFLIPSGQNEAILSYQGGELDIDLQNKTATLSPGSQ